MLSATTTATKQPARVNTLFNELAALIENGRRQIAVHANSTLTLLYWNIGGRINADILKHRRADYGKQTVTTLAACLTKTFGRGFEARNLRRMMQFAEQFPDGQIVSKLSTQLNWSHFIELLTVKSADARLFYAEQAASVRLGVMALRELIGRKAFERHEIADARRDADSDVPANLFKDPYIFDFLELRDGYLESDLEMAILRNIEQFILEFGRGFAFIERQKRMILDGEDFYLDLLFYNRILRRLVAVELKRGKFRAADKAQMELYLKWLDRNERTDGENPPVGVILCAEGNREQIEMLEMGRSGIMVAEYWTTLPPKKEFAKRIRAIVAEARERAARTQALLAE